MAYPYSTLATPISDATTATPTAHSGHHNSVHTALNDLLTELGTDPGGGSTVTSRLTTLDTKVVPAGGTAGQVLTKDTGTDYDTSWGTPPVGVPAGGTTDQVLAKNSGTDYDVEWQTVAAAGVPAGGTAGQVLTKDTGTDYDTSWATPTGGSTITASTQTASYTLVSGDAGTCVEMNVASANTLTVPPNSSVAFATGTIIEVHQYGAGQTTLTPGSGVTIRSDGSKLKLTAQYASASLRKRATDEWVAAGDLVA